LGWLENIESFISQSAEATNEGVRALKKAEEHQASARSKTWCMVGVIVVIVIIAVIVVMIAVLG
jgi:t-SNARE complex subunit (syntaxin)